MSEPQVIEWIDSFGCSANWGELDKSKVEPLTCFSVGWVIHEDEKCIVVAPHRTAPHPGMDAVSYCGDMTIPKVAIVNRTKLEPP